MSAYRAVLLALFVVGGALVAGAPAGATSDEATPEQSSLRVGADAPGATGVADARPAAITDSLRAAITDARPSTAANDTTNNSSLGADISSFMQSSAAEVGGAVESGMWTAAFNDTRNRSKRVRLVEARTDELEAQLAELRQRKAELLAEREAGNVSEVAFKAKISRLIGRINALQSAVNATTSRAKEVNAAADVERLATLQTEAKNLSGPEIAAVARNVTGVGNDRHGPPGDLGRGNGGTETDNWTTDPPNGAGSANNSTNASQRTGPPSDVGNAAMAANASENASGNGGVNATGTGPGSESANEAGNATGSGTGAGSAAGTGNGAGNATASDPGNGAENATGNASANAGRSGIESATGNATRNASVGVTGNETVAALGNASTGASSNASVGVPGNGAENVPKDVTAVGVQNWGSPSTAFGIASGADTVRLSTGAPTTAGLLGHVSDALAPDPFSFAPFTRA